jgi:hypothetical protein
MVAAISLVAGAVASTGCTSRAQRLADIEARLVAHANACFAPGRRIREIDSCMVRRGFRPPGWSVDDARVYSECEPVPVFGRSRYCVGLYVSFAWPAAPGPGRNHIAVEDGIATRWKVVTYDKFAGAPRMS